MKINATNHLFGHRSRLLFHLMRIFLLLLFTSAFSINNTTTWAQENVYIDADKEVTVDQVFEIIMNQTEFSFLYPENKFNDMSKVSLKKGITQVDKLLDACLGFGRFEVLFFENNTIVIKELNTRQQQYKVSGKVTDKFGFPMAGVTIIYKESPNKGTVTGIDGDYQIAINREGTATLQFSYVGYITQEIVVDSETTINVVMDESSTDLDEVVVIGYGSQKRSEVSSAVSSIKSDQVLENLGANTSFDRGLSGLIKGVQITQGSGQPGSGVDINIRGITSPFAGSDNNPLFVIDGVPFQANPTSGFSDITANNDLPNPLLTINPNDIESIDVLKDASATAIYGSRGANGVIIVNTKKGKKGEKTTMSFSTTSSFAKPIDMPKYLNSEQYQERAAHILAQSALFANDPRGALSIYAVNTFDYMADLPIDGTTISYNGLRPEWFGTANTRWAEEVYRNPAFSQNYNLSVTGGSDITSFGVTLGHTDQEGLLLEDEYKQYNFRANLDSQVNKIFTVGFNTNLSYSDNQTGYSDINGFLNSGILNARPDVAAYDEDGNIKRIEDKMYGMYDGQFASPLAKTTGYDSNTKTFSFLGNAYLEAELFKNFKLRSDINAARFSNEVNRFKPTSIVDDIVPVFGQMESTLSAMSSVNTNVVANLTANYNTTLSERHHLAALLGLAWDRSYSERTHHVYSGFPDDNVLTNATAALNVLEKAAAEMETGLNSIFSRVNYNYDEKYFLTLNFRTDRSSKFGPENQRGYFPSAAASWNIANESFLKDSKHISNLRLRSGYGRSGSNNVQDFAYLQFFAVGVGSEGLYNGNSAVGLNGTLPNEGIKWETTDEVNVGLDFGFLNNRIRGSIDVYERKTTDALMGGTYPLESGAVSFTQNFADLTNKGFEIDLFGDLIRNEDLRWTAGLNLSKNKNTLDRYNNTGVGAYLARYYEIGKEVNIIRGYQTEGIFQTQEEIDNLNNAAPDGIYQEVGTSPGDYKYKDLNGDGKITTEDQEYLGSAQPDFFGGFHTSVNYAGFDLSANFSFSVGGEATYYSDGGWSTE